MYIEYEMPKATRTRNRDLCWSSPARFWPRSCRPLRATVKPQALGPGGFELANDEQMRWLCLVREQLGTPGSSCFYPVRVLTPNGLKEANMRSATPPRSP